MMVDRTLQDLIVRTEQEIYMAAGIGTQVYAESNISQKLINAFEMIVTDPKIRWKRFNKFVQYSLDGVNGFTTTPILNNFASADDIYNVFPANSDAPLTLASSTRNPLLYTGTRNIQYAYDADNVIRILPTTSTEDIVVVGRKYSLTYQLTDIVPFDSLALIYSAAWQYSIDDGANSAMSMKFQTLFETRINQLKLNQAQEPISMTGGVRSDIPLTWRET